MNGKIYLAAPFFNEEQIKTVQRVERICLNAGVSFFSPRLECLCPPDASPAMRTRAFNLNIEHIRNAPFIFARIDDHDPGTIWEMGCAFAMRKTIYAYTTVKNRGLNLMLVEGGVKLVVGWDDITKFLQGNKTLAVHWGGEIE